MTAVYAMTVYIYQNLKKKKKTCAFEIGEFYLKFTKFHLNKVA